MEQKPDGERQRVVGENTEQVVKSAKKLVASAEGLQAIQSALRHAERTAAQFGEVRQIDPQSFHEPVTL